MPNRRKREGDMGPLGPDIIVEEPTLLESEWLKEDLGSLIGSGVDSQLNAILGPEEAELFLHPTIKDKPRHATSSSNHVLKDLKKSGIKRVFLNYFCSHCSHVENCCFTPISP